MEKLSHVKNYINLCKIQIICITKTDNHICVFDMINFFDLKKYFYLS